MMKNDWIISLEGLKKTLSDMGLSKGDMLYVASDMFWLLYTTHAKYDVKSREEKYNVLDDIVNVLQKMVGNEGTLLFPVFTWEFFRGNNYDIRKSLGETGALGNYVLEHRADFQRTLHVSHSFMVWGCNAKRLVSMDNTHAWLGNSPFDFLYNQHGQMLMLHVPAVKCVTFQHYAEERVQTPLRYIKEFRGWYTDCEGRKSERIYPHFVRDLRIESQQCMTDDFLIRKAGAVIDKWENGRLLLVDLRKAVDATEDDLLFNHGANCYEFDNYQMNGLQEATHKPEVFILQTIDKTETTKKFDDKSAYKVGLLSEKITPRQMMGHITIPKIVYKYRALKSGHLLDSLDGKMYFSLPSKINVNHQDDCKVNINKEKCKQALMKIYACDSDKAESIYNVFEKEWIQEGNNDDGTKRLGLQDCVRIACFTTVSPDSLEAENMWNEFGEGAGYCIEYEVTEDIFYPRTTVFLPVCYELDEAYDDTDYVLEMMQYLNSKSDKEKNPHLDERFVARGYNHTLFKPSRYRNEGEWRIVVPNNRYSSYFDDLEKSGYKFMKQAMKKIYTRKKDGGDSKLLDTIQEYADNMHIEHVKL